MLKIRSKTAFRVFLYIVSLLIVYILQALVFTNIKLMGVRPLLFPIAVVGTALFSGSRLGGVYGLLAGMLCDISLNQPTIEFTLVLTITGIIVGLLSEKVLTKGFPSYAICSVVALIVSTLIQSFGMAALSGALMKDLLEIGWRQVVYSAIFILPMYYLLRFVSRI